MCLRQSLLLFALTQAPCNSRLLRHSEDVGSLNLVTEEGSPTCASLANKGSHFTVDIEAGTPGQSFSVVADTGSDSVIIPSCICKERGACGEQDRCFRGTGKSSTFLLRGFNATELKTKQPQRLPIVQMVFGSGAVQAVISTDIVQVGNLKAKMQDGLLLMVDHQLRMPGSAFEGILGLGQPKNETEIQQKQKQMEEDMAAKRKVLSKQMATPLGSKKQPAQVKSSGLDPATAMEAIKRMLRGIGGGSGGGVEDALGAFAFDHPQELEALGMSMPLQPIAAPQQLPIPAPDKQSEEAEERPAKQIYRTKSFLQAAGITRFSMCFNDRGKQGALNLGIPKAKDALTSIGTVHWGLDFQGITIGEKKVPVKVCSPESKKEGQISACGAIPDSGTTLFMGPQEHIQELFAGLCDEWKRCRSTVSNGLQHKKAEMFSLLLSECGNWMTEQGGLDELPTLRFQLAGGNGKKKTISLDGAAYVIETMEEQMKIVQKNIMGMPLKVPQKTGKKSKVCAPAFGTMDINTKDHGPVWIFGSPIFYEYTVGYDLDKSKPAISFSQEPCGCSKETALVLKTNQSEKHMARQPRVLHGPPRMPTFDFTLGL